MTKSYLLISNDDGWLQTQTLRLVSTDEKSEWDKLATNPDTYFVQAKKTIGIDHVRNLIAAVSLKPYQELQRVAIIENAHHLTQEAQNALLKLLEEPPTQTTIFLWASDQTILLPTLVSRCFVVSNTTPTAIQATPENQGHIEALLQDSYGERLLEAKKIQADETMRGSFIADALYFFRSLLLSDTAMHPNLSRPKIIQAIETLLRFETLTAKQINSHFLIDLVVLKLPRLPKKDTNAR